MKYRMYCLFNKVTELYEGIMLYRTDVIACRAFESMLEANKGKVSASDLSLYCLGTFDNETAAVYFQGEPGLVEFVPRSVPEESRMDSARDDTSVL